MTTHPPEFTRRSMLAFALPLAGATAAGATTGCGGASASTVPTARLFRTDVGAGRGVLLLHGWSCDAHDWSWQLPALEARYRVVAVDLRGHGRSEVMPPGAYTPEHYVADIEALLERDHGGEPFIVAGHSMGAQIGARLAARRPDLVTALVSVDGSLGFSDALLPVFQKATDDLAVGEPGSVGPALFELFYDRATDPAFKRWHARRLQGTPTHVVRESFGPLFLGDGQVGVGEASARLCTSLPMPVYHLCRDPAQAERMRPWFRHPRSRVDVWEHAGHWIMQDRRDDVNTAITAWIDTL